MKSMTIWIDADGCPVRVRNIVIKASLRTGVPAVLVSDRPLPVRERGEVSLVQVPKGEDSADGYIRCRSAEGDIAVSRDLLLAEGLVEKGVLVLDDRGELYTGENIRERISLKERMMEFRAMGITPESGSGTAGEREVKAFASAFDRVLSRRLKELSRKS